MARQSTTPVEFGLTRRTDDTVLMTSGRAGVVVPAGFIPVLAGDSASGRVGLDVELAEMPKPLLNAVSANFQAWFVPKSAHPRFSGRDELNHARTGENIKALGAADRAPPAFFSGVPAGSANWIAARDSALFKTLGLHLAWDAHINTELIDAFNLVYNFRLASHSSRLPRRQYALESFANATTLPPAFWPSSRLSRVVPDYERALIVGSLDLDVVAGRMPISGIGVAGSWAPQAGGIAVRETDSDTNYTTTAMGGASAAGSSVSGSAGNGLFVKLLGSTAATVVPNVYAEMSGQSVGVTLADIDKARTTQAFAKLRTAYAGNDSTGFDNDDTIVALLMQGLVVPPDQFKRPWLLDSKRVPVGFAQRFATDAANLDASVSRGRASAVLSLNVPRTEVDGIIIITVEVLPERIDERMSDEFMHCVNVDELPNALRDVQRTEPVDIVLNRRVDAKHANPSQGYGFEPMNDKWNRSFTRLGGDFYMAAPGGGWTENRSNIWQTEIVNPTLTGTHYLAPSPFPHDVFADQNASAFELVCRHQVVLQGLTQIGDVLAENNDDYEAVQEAGL